MSSIMRARSGLTGRGEVSEVIGLFSRAEGCWTFDARDQMPRPSRAIAHYPVDNPPTAMRSRSRASGFVHRRLGDEVGFYNYGPSPGGYAHWRPVSGHSWIGVTP